MLTVRKKYVDINGNVSKDKLQSMFRYFVYGEIIVHGELGKVFAGLHGPTVGDPKHEPLHICVPRILYRHPSWRACGFGDDTGGKSGVRRFFPASSGCSINQCLHR